MVTVAGCDVADARATHFAEMMIGSGVLTRQFGVLLELELVQGTPGFVADVVSLYMADSASRIEQMAMIAGGARSGGNGECAGSDFAELERLGHKFAGSSATFGSASMAALCARLSASAAAGDRDACQETIGWLRDEMAQLTPMLERFLKLDVDARRSASSRKTTTSLQSVFPSSSSSSSSSSSMTLPGGLPRVASEAGTPTRTMAMAISPEGDPSAGGDRWSYVHEEKSYSTGTA